MHGTSIPSFDHYVGLVDPSQFEEIAALAQAIAGVHIVHINTTARGGGVVELLENLLAFFQGVAIHQTWEVVDLDGSSDPFLTSLIDQVQGGEPGQLPQGELDRFQHSLLLASQSLKQHHADVYCVHDLQLAPLAALLPTLQPAIWFCHMDVSESPSAAKQYVASCLEPYRLCIFNTFHSLVRTVPQRRAQVIPPGLHPFKKKHAELSPTRGMSLLASCGIDVKRPLITQVSRFERWKNPWQAIDIYRQVKKDFSTVQLALVGALEATDDPTASEVLAHVRSYADADPDIYLLADPKRIGPEEVNAFQRYSTIIVQRSLREGFGLTATEAMWKKQPVVGTSATGLCAQIIDQQTGFIIDETEQCARCILQLLEKPDMRDQLGRQAHEHVKKHFLFPRTALAFLRAVNRVLHEKEEAGAEMNFSS